MEDKIIIFTDGSSLGNPGAGGYGAIIVFDGFVKELGGFVQNTTNNRMEITSVIEALSSLVNENKTKNKIVVYSDSRYVINGITKWIHSWSRNGFMTSGKKEVLNKDLWEKLLDLKNNFKISFSYLPGHSGVAGNERADLIATSFAKFKKFDLFDGDLENYGIPILDLKIDYDKKELKDKKTSKAKQGKAYSYLSLVGGVCMRHDSWAKCEKRVKGVKNTKFIKTMSLIEEENIINKWGCSSKIVNDK